MSYRGRSKVTSSSRKMKPGNWILLIVMILLGSIFILSGVVDLFVTGLKNRTYKETDGVVIGHKEYYDNENRTTSYDSIVEYKVNGKVYSKVIVSSYSFKEEVGKEHIVKYNPKNPEDIYISDGIPEWAGNIFTGIFFIIIPVFIIVKSEKIIEIMLPFILGGIGMALLYYCKAGVGSLNPIKNPLSIIGYMFISVTLLVLVGLFSGRKNPEEAGYNLE